MLSEGVRKIIGESVVEIVAVSDGVFSVAYEDGTEQTVFAESEEDAARICGRNRRVKR